ncbi:Hpt domain-containing protein [Oleiagrimonas soli]|uniref:Chemotaxis protein CheA n=1 Tax=Oleiagrimonas soli TaxID=1543381 RepID=A0A099CXZ4_9GAMM|nr:Hpt domain-containing protein [Oleiagrimonas soli]KGI78629.1 chemotaxis protein CheA [Oleiagrimonas soli]MBB6184073.1 chemosensory pili system protein ChpA (sensor histidine kinase/response regulator) [Oleiagrimonas soli]
MRLEDDIDFTTLNWVKSELDEALQRARDSLEAYVENPDSGLMRTCAEVLHQVQGTLRMVELYGAAMVVQEMEQLVAALLDNKVENRDEAYSALMGGLVQLPDYLERLQSSHRDVSVVLLPLLNELRSSRGAESLHESVLFTPNLDAPLPASAPGVPVPMSPEAQKRAVTELRQQFQQPLLAWFRGQGGKQSLAQMRDTMDALAGKCHSVAGRRLWWITAGVLDGMIEGHLEEHSAEVKQLIGRVDRAIRVLIDEGEIALADGHPVELARQLLYYVARATPGSQRLAAIGQTYGLNHLLPDAAEVEHARSSMTGHNRVLLDTVSQAIKEDLLRVKDALDLYLRQPSGDPAQFSGQADLLDRVADTLGMLGLNVPRRVVGEQRRIVQDIASGTRPADEETLLDVAGALLYVEASLDDHIESLGADGGQGEPSEDDEDAFETMLPRSEARQVLGTLMRESVGSLGKVKDAIVAFIESPWDHQHLEGAPNTLSEIAGAMRMLGEERPGELLDGVGRFIDNELVIEKRIPTTEQMDKLADALASLEYYLEAARDRRGGLEHILDVAEQALRDLGYWPVPPRRAPEPAAADEPTAATETTEAAAPSENLTETVSVAPGADLHDLVIGEAAQLDERAQDVTGLHLTDTEATGMPESDDWIEIEEEIEEDGFAPDPLAAEAGFQGTTDEIDAEIREVFLEEVEEEIEGLQQRLDSWKQKPEDHDRLTPIRRAFHTLKGSGRLVGARVLGEFSWKVENMLNRVLDGSIAPDAKVVALIDHAVAALPQLLGALRGDAAPTAPLSKIMEVAERLAAGESLDVEAELKPTGERVKRIVKRRVPRVQTEVEDIPAAAFVDTTHGDEASGRVADDDMMAMPALPPMDPVLLEILRSEIAQHLETVQTALETAGDGELKVNEPLLRAVHTMHGAIAMVEVPLLSEVLSPLEGYLKRLRASETLMPREGCAAMREAVQVTEQVAAQFDASEPLLPETAALVQRLCALRDTLAEPNLAHVVYGHDLLDEAVSEAEDAFETEASQPENVAAEEHAEEDTFDMARLEAEMASALSSDSLIEPDLTTDDAQPLTLGDEDEADETPAATISLEDALTETDVEDTHTQVEDAREDLPEDTQEETQEETSASTEEAPELSAEDEAVDAAEPADTTLVEAFAEDADTHAEDAAAEPSAEPEVFADSEEDRAATAQTVTAESAPAPAPATSALGDLPEDYAFPDDPQPEGALDKPDLDADLLEIFIEEGRDILDHSDSVMAKLREAPQAREYMVDLKRDLHTLKGGARMASLEEIGGLGHAMETLLEAVDAGHASIDPITIESLERGFDRLHALVQRVGNGQAVAMPDKAIAYFEALARGEKVVAVAPGTTEEPESAEVVVESAPTPSEPVAAEPPRRRPPPLIDEEELSRAPQEMIRVRAELLDSLVNYAGEVSIYRARLEQQVSSYRYNLVEFEQTVDRLRDQLRKLEIETEAQIIARYQRENEDAGQASFDPLELDRFSQLQQYSRALAESVADLVSLQTMLDDITRQSETLLLQQSRVSSDLQEGLMRTRMVPFDSMVPTLRRTLRQASTEVGKRAQLRVTGAHGEMDRNLLERMKAPFEHMMRNALAHGIESPDDRARVGKPAEGTVAIDVSRDSTEVLIRVQDDGAGIDRDAIRRKAIERGLLREDAKLSDRDLFGFILESGFSTAQSVTQLAGRGVGMDVVANEIKQMGGTLTIDSQRGQGTTFNIRLPFTLAVTQAIMVKVGELTFALPMTSVQGVARISREELKRRLSEENPTFTYAGEDYGIHDLAQLLDVPAGHLVDDMQPPLLLARSGDLRAAVRIDSVIGSREIVVKSVGPQISSVPGIFGATIMGDGSVVMILDLAPLVRHGVALKQHAEAQDEAALQAKLPTAQSEQRVNPLVMVVDDSITMRKVSGRILERHDYEVSTAKDGMDAVEKLQERVPDVMLLDIEMPRMDGYELATYMKNDPRLKDVPIIMITSRTGEKHRQRALDIGVERYLGKPYQEADLIANIRELLGDSAE